MVINRNLVGYSKAIKVLSEHQPLRRGVLTIFSSYLIRWENGNMQKAVNYPIKQTN